MSFKVRPSLTSRLPTPGTHFVVGRIWNAVIFFAHDSHKRDMATGACDLYIMSYQFLVHFTHSLSAPQAVITRSA